MNTFNVASMFAGIGGICLGFKQAGFKIVWANEKDKAACNTYRYNNKNVLFNEGDIRNVSPSDIPNMDVLIAGFPCQSFSIAGNLKGFADPRGNLFFEIARIIDIKRPKVIFLENVNNLVEHDNGRTFLVIYNSLVQFGYAVRYRIMDANEFGNLPQPRSRIFIVAFLDYEVCDMFQFPEPIDLTIGINNIIKRNEKKHEIYYLNNESWIIKKFSKQINDRCYIYRIGNDGGLVRVRNHFCPTLTAQMGTRPDKVPFICDDFGIRKLTLRECLDFQGFPQEFKFPKSITINDAYKQIGNSVCVPVVRRIAERLKFYLSSDIK